MSRIIKEGNSGRFHSESTRDGRSVDVLAPVAYVYAHPSMISPKSDVNLRSDGAIGLLH